MKKLLALAGLLWLLPQVVAAQITVPYSFTSGTTISAAQMNANFAAVADALNRTGGTMTGGILFGTDNLFDLGASGASRPRRIYVGTEVVSPLFTGALAGNASTATALAADPADCAANQVAIGIGASGALSCATVADSYISGLSATKLTGTIDTARLSGTYGISVSGSAATLTTTRTIWGQSFNGSANVSGAFSGATTGAFSSNVTIGGTLGVTGNAAFDADTLFVDAANNRVGVGTTSPAKRLHVTGSDASTTTTFGVQVQNENTTTNSRAGVVFANFDNYGAAIWSPRTGSAAGALVFGTNGGAGTAETNIAERMRIDSSGNVGIGTTSPAYKLEVNGTLGVTGAITGSLTGNASTASALAANPTDCPAGQFATAIAANGNLTCTTVALGGEIIGATITGGTIRTAASGSRVELTASPNALRWYDGSTLLGTISNAGVVIPAPSDTYYDSRTFGYSFSKDAHIGGLRAWDSSSSANSKNLGLYLRASGNASSMTGVSMRAEGDADNSGNPGYGSVLVTGTDTAGTPAGTVYLEASNGNATYQHYLIVGHNLPLQLQDGLGNQRLVVEQDGDVAIGASSASYKLDVTGTGRFTSTLYATTISTTSGALTIDPAGTGRVDFAGTDIEVDGVYQNGGAWFAGGGSTTLCDFGGWIYRCSSSARWKEHIVTAEADWAKVLAIRPVRYDEKATERNPHPATGLFGAIAEEVDALGLTDLVSYGQDGLPENVRYERIALYLIPLIQEQRTEIEVLKTQLSALEARLAALEQRAKPCEGPECLR